MDKQIKLYSVDTKAFYTLEEKNCYDIKMYANRRINNIKNELKKQSVEFVKTNKDMFLEHIKFYKDLELIQDGIDPEEFECVIDEKEELSYIEKNIFNKLIKKHKKYEKFIFIKNKADEKFNELVNDFKGVRCLNKKYLNDKNRISLFESSLTRTMKFEIDKTTNDILVLRPYHYIIFKQLIERGYNFNDNGVNKHFTILTASAGQIRTKKCVFINEELWNKYEKTLLCGLTIKDMNKSKEKGMNLTKYMAYLALNNSATDEWEDFDIDRCIVVKDFETNVNGLVDYIDVNKLKDNDIEDCIKRKRMDVPIPHSDGCGMILPKLSKINFMTRLPWIKGLLTPCNFIRFCQTERKKMVNGEWINDLENYTITDIYGVEHDLLKENIQIIFTESQFKAYKYYTNDLDENGNIIKTGWDKYKEWFKKYNCSANKCNEEPSSKREFRQANLNYQMLQTSTNVSDEEIKYFTEPIEEYIIKGYSDLKTQLHMLKATKENNHPTNLQKALMIYPEMIQESYCKSQLSDILNKRKKEAKYGKFKTNATYTFLLPDVYAWMEYMFNGDKNPKGILKHNLICSCKLYDKISHVVVNRSPHLNRELGVRLNRVDKNTKRWFITNGCYTSCHDLISKLLQFDNDGDKCLFIVDEVYYNIAKRNMKNTVPLYYEMAKAKPQEINKKNLYTALTEGYKYGNVGQYSNKITVLWNEDNPDENAIKLLTCLNNFYIDGAKSGYMPEISETIKQRLKVANGKLPYFFKFAKDKEEKQVKKINNSTVNRICKNIEQIKQKDYDFSHHGIFRYNTLLNNKSIEVNEDLVKYYLKLEKKYRITLKNSELEYKEITKSLYDSIKNDMEVKRNELNISYENMVDMIALHLYEKRKNNKKKIFWDLYGEQIIINLRNNLKQSLENGKYKMCECCGKRFKTNKNDYSSKYCNKCSIKVKNKQKRLSKHKMKGERALHLINGSTMRV